MNRHIGVHTLLGSAVALTICVIGGALPRAQAPLAIDSGRITISGTSNIHAYTASTTAIRVTKAQFAAPTEGVDIWTNALNPGGVAVFEVAIPAATLTSPREGLDNNMHKALQVTEHADILFRLLRFEPRPGVANGHRAIGVLTIAGVEREVAMNITTTKKGAVLFVQGQLSLLMTDWGIKPPVALMGMLKTDPKVTVTFEATLATPLT
jgi:polyisoprenoid-binding protein YceI